ncbi:MAG: FAD-dependent oxidoreductase [Planctomycetota bacterium]
MPRSPLLRAVIQIAQRIRASQRLGIPVAAVDELAHIARVRRKESGLPRRRFLIGAAAAGFAAMRPAWSHLGRAAAPRVAIVGAGISGLACALALADAGMKPTLYEAAPRVGGRMFSNNTGYWTGNQVSEWCGEFIDSSHSTVRGLATRFNLTLDDVLAAQPGNAKDTYYFDGSYYSIADAISDFQAVLPKVQADEAGSYDNNGELTPLGVRIDRGSLRQWIQKNVPGGVRSRLGQLLDVAYVLEYGAETSDLSGMNIVDVLSGSDAGFEIVGTSDERYNIRGGNELLPQAIAAYLQQQTIAIQTSNRLVKLRTLPDNTYRLSFETTNGTSDVDADFVVLTLPFAVLRSLDYRGAGFDALKRRTIRDLGRGVNGKLQLQFNSRHWNSTGAWGISNGNAYSDTGLQGTWDVTRAQAGTMGILNDYTGGRTTQRMTTKVPFANISNANVQIDAAQFLTQLDPVYPGLSAEWNSKATNSLPHLSPYFQCSYAYWRPGQVNAFAGTEGLRQGNILFAGEHTSEEFQGYMEGGAAEGVRAANELIGLL